MCKPVTVDISFVPQNGNQCDYKRRAAMKAKRAAQQFVTQSKFFDQSKFSRLPRFNREELELGRLIANGGFNHVFEIRRINIDDDHNYPEGYDSKHDKREEECDEIDERMSLVNRCLMENHPGGHSPYVVKFLRHNLLKNPRKFAQGAADLVVEAFFLSSLDHPNIIKIHGVSSSGTDGFVSRHAGEYFIMLERLEETLEKTIQTWKHMDENIKKIKNMFLDLKGTKRKSLLRTRLKVALDLAKAMAYLHEKKIVYRDLKPDNVGLDMNGNVKLLDFGLSKEITSQHKFFDNTYKLSGSTGSPRYMAPEVARNLSYNLSADVYSFAILLWEIYSLQKPFDGWSVDEHVDLVVYGGERPPLSVMWPSSIKKILNLCWSDQLNKRPGFQSIVESLEKEIIRCGGGAKISTQKMPANKVAPLFLALTA